MESTESNILIFYDLYPKSVVDITTVRNTVDVLRLTGLKAITFIMDMELFSSLNIEYLVESGVNFIMPHHTP